MKKILNYIININEKFNKYYGWFFYNGRKVNPYEQS